MAAVSDRDTHGYKTVHPLQFTFPFNDFTLGHFNLLGKGNNTHLWPGPGRAAGDGISINSTAVDSNPSYQLYSLGHTKEETDSGLGRNLTQARRPANLVNLRDDSRGVEVSRVPCVKLPYPRLPRL